MAGKILDETGLSAYSKQVKSYINTQVSNLKNNLRSVTMLTLSGDKIDSINLDSSKKKFEVILIENDYTGNSKLSVSLGNTNLLTEMPINNSYAVVHITGYYFGSQWQVELVYHESSSSDTSDTTKRRLLTYDYISASSSSLEIDYQSLTAEGSSGEATFLIVQG